MDKNLDKILKAYLETVLETEKNKINDNDTTLEDFSMNSIKEAKEDIISFLKTSKDLVNDISEEEIGKNLYLLRKKRWKTKFSYNNDLLTSIINRIFKDEIKLIVSNVGTLYLKKND